jgi:ectoine hydroxylase-related dioxygenase (phytanoyl-CoA dioxygenase family)
MKDRFQSEGYCAVPNMLSASDCQAILNHESKPRPKPINWMKGRAASDPFYAHLGSHQQLVKPLRELLGENVVLWGVDILHRQPSQVHPWHCDIESCDPNGGFVSIWIGVQNTSKESALNLISRSHKYGVTIQERAHREGVKREEIAMKHIHEWAADFDPESELIKPEVGNGDALFFDGRLWHGTHNVRSEGTRVAILLQYAAADRDVKLIDFKNFSWPLQRLENPRPPVLVVSGQGDPSHNLIANRP